MPKKAVAKHRASSKNNVQLLKRVKPEHGIALGGGLLLFKSLLGISALIGGTILLASTALLLANHLKNKK